MALLNDADFDPATFAPTPGMLAQIIKTLRPSGKPPEGWAPGLDPPMDVPPPPGGTGPTHMATPDPGGGGAIMPVPMPPPDQAALPPNSTPATDIPAALKGKVPESSLLGRIGEMLGNNSNTLLALGAGMAGAQNIGQGMRHAFALAGPAQQIDRQNQQQNQTVEALVKRGIPKDVALAAANNPAIMQQLIGQVFGPKALQHVTIKDRNGNEIPLAFNPSTGQYTKGETGAFGGGSGDPNLTGEAYLKTLDPLTRNEVKAFAEGRAPVTARNLQQMLPLVTQYDPNFQAADYPVKLATRKNYTSGKQFQEVQAINTVAGHLDNLSKSADELNNTRFPWWNQVANAAAQATGDPRVDKFNTDKQAVTNELSKAYRGGHVTEGDVKEWQQNISAAKSPQQLKAVIGEFNDLLMSKRQALEDGYKSSMGPAPLPDEFSSVSKHAKEVFDRVGGWAHGEKPAAPAQAAAPASAAAPPAISEGATATGPNGVKVKLVGNKWVPVQ